jgi:hypothetical protein
MIPKLWYEETEDEPRPVSFYPCPQFRLPVDGDLLTCADCRWWIEDHALDVCR